MSAISTICYVGLVLCISTSPNPVEGIIGSSSGSGSGMMSLAPIQCPVSQVNVSLIATIGTVQLNSTAIGLPMTSGTSMLASVTTELLPANDNFLLSSGFVVVRTILERNNNSVIPQITVEDSVGYLSSRNTIRLDIYLVVTDPLMIQQPCTCNYTIEISIEDPAVCTNIQSSIPLITSLQITGLEVLYSITITFNTAISTLEQMQIQNITANAMTDYCINNCGRCSMESSCVYYLATCARFSRTDVVIVSVQNSVQITLSQVVANAPPQNLIDVTLYVRLLSGAPVQSTASRLPFISADVVQQVAIQSINMYEAALGANVIGTPQVVVSNPALIATQPIAAIVVPILVILAVLALVLGIVIILVIVCMKKSKRSGKVQPEERSTSKNILVKGIA